MSHLIMQLLLAAAECRYHRDLHLCRPCLMLPAELSQCGDRWCASYGELLAFGDTPEEAFTTFDSRFIYGNTYA